MGLDIGYDGPGLDTGFEYSAIPSMEEPFSFGWDPEPLPQLEAVMPDYGDILIKPTSRPYLPADDMPEYGSILTFDMPAGFGPGAGFDPYLESEFQVVEPTWYERGWDIWGSEEIAPLRDSLLNKYVLKPETETVNTAGQTETHVNPQATPPRGSVPIGSIPQSTVFFPWQQPGDIGDAPQAGPGPGVSTSVLLIGGLVLFLLTR